MREQEAHPVIEIMSRTLLITAACKMFCKFHVQVRILPESYLRARRPGLNHLHNLWLPGCDGYRLEHRVEP